MTAKPECVSDLLRELYRGLNAELAEICRPSFGGTGRTSSRTLTISSAPNRLKSSVKAS